MSGIAIAHLMVRLRTPSAVNPIDTLSKHINNSNVIVCRLSDDCVSIVYRLGYDLKKSTFTGGRQRPVWIALDSRLR